MFRDIRYLTVLLLIINFTGLNKAQNFWKIKQLDEIKPTKKPNEITWCTKSLPEQLKCLNFAMANERDQIKVKSETVKIKCIQAATKDDCMELLDQEKATMTTLDAGEVFVGGRYRSLVPIAQEILDGGFNFYYSVAVIKKDTLHDVLSVRDLRGKKACFPSVETFAGWMLPISTLMKEGNMEIVDCNNHVKSATEFFGPSCAVNCLSDKYNPIGDNSDKLCQLCIGKIPGGRCTDADPYAGYEGAFRCLLEAGEIAFLKHTTVAEMLSISEFSSLSNQSFELLCKDGSRRPLSEYLACNWGRVPSDAVIVSSAVTYEDRDKFQKYLLEFAMKYPKLNTQNSSFDNNYSNQPQYDQFGNRISNSNSNQFDNSRNNEYYDQFGANNNNKYRGKRQNFDAYDERYNTNDNNRFGNNADQFNTGGQVNDFNKYSGLDQYGNTNLDEYGLPVNRSSNQTYYEVFSLFDSTPRYGIHGNLLFQDAARGFVRLPENKQTYTAFLSDVIDIIMGVRACPVNRMTLCVTSDAENNKCIKMRTALKAQLVKPEMECYKGHSQIHCMQAIRAGTADVAVLDASDVYTAGLNFDLVPFISEVYNLDDADYYVVAVAKESDPSTELTYLRTKNTCHGGINLAAGWVYPLAFLISNGWIRPYGCNSIRAAAEYFTKSCVPGAISAEYNTGVPYDNMCDLCHGTSYRYCRRDASEDYYGHTGAFRCLVEGGGHVAFVKHTTVTENTGGKKKEWWTRDNLNDDYELLCPDGTRAEINEYTKCNLGKVKANAIVTRGGYGYDETQINAYINLFMYSQSFYGRKTADEFSFSMFTSPPPYSDLIFQDATTQLKVVEPSKRYYSSYLGPDFMRARRIVDCHAGSSSITVSVFVLTLSTLFAIFVIRN